MVYSIPTFWRRILTPPNNPPSSRSVTPSASPPSAADFDDPEDVDLYPKAKTQTSFPGVSPSQTVYEVSLKELFDLLGWTIGPEVGLFLEVSPRGSTQRISVSSNLRIVRDLRASGSSSKKPRMSGGSK